MKSIFAVKGDICYTEKCGELKCFGDSYIVSADGKVEGIYKELPKKFAGIEVYDRTGKLICPGMADLHIHAPQYAYRGTGMDLELLDWLNTITFPQEAKYADMEFAAPAYDMFAQDMRDSATTRAVVFASIHREATEYLMEKLDKLGVGAYVGKVNMDRNSPDYYVEKTDESVSETLKWIGDTADRYELVRPILTPRFVPSCTDPLMEELGKIAKLYGLPVQSHLSENLSEIDWVHELAPDSKGYADAYDRFDLFGSVSKTVMAHCVHMRNDEIKLMKKRGVYVAHSPQSNENLRSGVAPIRRFLEEGLHVGLATDVAGGSSMSMFDAVRDAIQVSKLRWRLVDDSATALKFTEAFYMATKGGGSFFGKVGSFESGYEFDALVIDDKKAGTVLDLDIASRLERTMYLAGPEAITDKFVSGRKIK